jgi:hypothetical protein
MEKKVCTKCKEEKDVTEFSSSRNDCKLCAKEYQKKYRENNKEKIRQSKKEYREKNKEKIRQSKKVYRKKYGEILSIKNKEYRENNKEKIRQTKKEYSENNKEKIRQTKKLYRENNKEILSIKKKEYREKNKEKIRQTKKLYRENDLVRIKLNKYKREWKRKRCETDLVYKLKVMIEKSIHRSFKKSGYTKNSRSYRILGCSYEEFKLYIESKFEYWMNWENYGLCNGEEKYGWDLDHIIPLSSGKCEEDIIRLNHHSNIQPLCSYINRCIKKDKIEKGISNVFDIVE